MRFIQYSTVLAGAWLVVGCGGNPEQGKSEETVDTLSTEVAIETETQSPVETDFVLPSTVQVGQIFKKAGLPFVSGVTNNPENVANYNTKVEKLLAYGVYSTDLSYCILNDQNEDAMEYMKAVRGLADDLGLTEIYEAEDLFERFEKSMGDQNAILDIMIEVQERTDVHIDDNNLSQESAVLFAGAWIEGMYFGVKAADPNEKKEISMRLIEQMTILDNLIQGLESVDKKSKKLDDLKSRFQKMEDTFNGFEEVKGMEEGSVIDLEISMGNLKELADQIIEIRTVVVN